VRSGQVCRERKDRNAHKMSAALEAVLVSVGQEEEVMYLLVDDGLDEIGAVGRTISDRVIRLQSYGEDAGAIVFAAFQNLTGTNELSLYALRMGYEITPSIPSSSETSPSTCMEILANQAPKPLGWSDRAIRYDIVGSMNSRAFVHLPR
jgi:hypothetical protein